MKPRNSSTSPPENETATRPGRPAEVALGDLVRLLARQAARELVEARDNPIRPNLPLSLMEQPK